MGLGDFKQIERDLGLDSVETTGSSFGSSISDFLGGFRTVANELGTTAGTIADIKKSFETSSETNKMRQDYQDIKQDVNSKTPNINKDQIVYLGIGAVALFLIFGGK